MNKIVKRVIDYLVINAIIEEEEKEIYAYGLYQGILIVLNTLTTIVIGFLFTMVVESILFMIAYIPLRSYAGGYHAKTELRCYLVSIILIITALLLISFVPAVGFIILGITGMSGMVIYIFSPVEDRNKPLDKKEYKIYKKKSRNILATQIMLIILTYLLRLRKVSLIISIAIFILSLMLVIGKSIHNKSQITNV